MSTGLQPTFSEHTESDVGGVIQDIQHRSCAWPQAAIFGIPFLVMRTRYEVVGRTMFCQDASLQHLYEVLRSASQKEHSSKRAPIAFGGRPLSPFGSTHIVSVLIV